ncbi:hypothetical protein AB0N29_01805 [Nocardioides sp. NPDC092400]|uniref:hypothetical protein n=1 Tax=Nocardioides sp. NPDC092400 TaxID=3155196 RepID=UPI003423DEA5
MTSATPAPPGLPPLDKAPITAAAEAWLQDELRLTAGAVERVRAAARLIAGEEVTRDSAREARNRAALSIREYGLAATSPVVKRERNVRLAEATGITRPALRVALEDFRVKYGEVPLVADAAQTLPALAAEAWLHSERVRVATDVRHEGICRLLAAGWSNVDIAKVAQVNPSRVAQIKTKWGEAGGTVLPPDLRPDSHGSPSPVHTASAGAEPTADGGPAPDAEGVALASDDGLTFDGDLTREGRELQRREQALLRRVLFAAATSALCALCGDELPVRFLRAAHIKKRSSCTEDERRNLAHIAMAACVFGCDALYEDGFITVDETGIIEVCTDEPLLYTRMEALRGRSCSAFSRVTSPYFAWHRAIVWRGPGKPVATAMSSPELS